MVGARRARGSCVREVVTMAERSLVEWTSGGLERLGVASPLGRPQTLDGEKAN